jgi:Tol biopolymer transport system component
MKRTAALLAIMTLMAGCSHGRHSSHLSTEAPVTTAEVTLPPTTLPEVPSTVVPTSIVPTSVLAKVPTTLKPKVTTTTAVPVTKVDRAGIYVVNLDGSGLKRLAAGVTDLPSWSPDSTAVAYTLNNGLYVTRLSGETATATQSATLPRDGASWDPAGTALAYPAGSGGDRDIYVADAKGGGAHALPNPGDDSASDWSTTNRLASMGYNGLFVFNPDNGQRMQIYTAHLNFGVVRWSPDGTMLATAPDSESDHFIINADGTNRRIIGGSGDVHVTTLSWSPDSRNLVFEGYNPTTSVFGTWVAGADGSALRPLHTSDMQPDWSKDGDWIAAIQGDANTPWGVAVMAPDGGQRHTILTLDPGAYRKLGRPRFSPDGTKIAFAAY